MMPPVLKTENYILQPYRKADLERYLEMALDKEVVTFMGGATGDIAAERKMFGKIFDVYKMDSSRWFWIWGVYRHNILCAHLEVKQSQDTNSNELEMVYMVHPKERGKGLM